MAATPRAFHRRSTGRRSRAGIVVATSFLVVLGVAVAGFAATRTGTETLAKCTTTKSTSGAMAGSLAYTDASQRERLTTWRHYHPALSRWIDDHRTLAADAA